MAGRSNNELFEAIFFFGKKSVIKEMRYSEFEAILDGVVGVTELAGKEVCAAYLTINHSLQVKSLVTFQIEFNAKGYADEDWNIPLRHLAENAGPGPDIGGGPLRLACRSQCSVSWYQRELWEPNSKDVNHFALIRESVLKNKLGLIVDNAPQEKKASIPVATERFETHVPTVSDKIDVNSELAELEVAKKLEQQSAEFELKIKSLKLEHKSAMHQLEAKFRVETDQVKRAMRNETQTYRRHAQDIEQKANQSQVLLDKLQVQNASLSKEIEQAQSLLLTQKNQYEEVRADYLEALDRNSSLTNENSTSLAELQSRIQKFEQDKAANEQLTSQLKTENQLLQDQVALYQSQLENAEVEVSQQTTELNEALEQRIKALAEREAELTLTKDQNMKLTQENESLNKEILNLQTLKAETQADSDSRERLVLELQETKQALQQKTMEYDALKADFKEIDDAGDGQSVFIDKMDSLDLVFVAYHPGAGHISLPTRQLEDYLESPLAIAAQKCGVTLDQYQQWLSHYEKPECKECAISLDRVGSPSDFQKGHHDYCSKHRALSENVTMFRKLS